MPFFNRSRIRIPKRPNTSARANGHPMCLATTGSLTPARERRFAGSRAKGGPRNHGDARRGLSIDFAYGLLFKSERKSRGDPRKLVLESRSNASAKSTSPRAAARSSTPSVPVTASPRWRATPRALRSSSRTRPSSTDSARTMASRSPGPSCRSSVGISAATRLSSQCGVVSNHAPICAGAAGERSSRRTASGTRTRLKSVGRSC